MNNHLIISTAILIFVFLTSCQKDDNEGKNIQVGYYEGYFAYSNDTIWEAISFKVDSFFERPSGGLPLGSQKFPCIVKGIYKICDAEIVFELSEYPRPELQCDSNIILSGTFVIQTTDDSILFWKGEGNEKQLYNLKLQSASR
jgi:hypothetical protein